VAVNSEGKTNEATITAENSREIAAIFGATHKEDGFMTGGSSW